MPTILEDTQQTIEDEDNNGLHIERQWVSGCIVIMWCGRVGIISEDGKVSPDGMDFFLQENAANSTCKKCRATHARG